MHDYNKLEKLALACGFTHTAPMAVSTLEFMQDIRNMCNADQCENFNKSWSCPPACESLEDMRKLVEDFDSGILTQTVGELEDSYDWDGIMQAKKRQKEAFSKLRAELKKEYEIMAMGTGVCEVCPSCTYPDEPCRYPDKMEVSMEACGLFVSKVCADNGLSYNYGPDKIAFTACFLVK